MIFMQNPSTKYFEDLAFSQSQSFARDNVYIKYGIYVDKKRILCQKQLSNFIITS